mgnify:CR=1 FL=1
MNLETINFIKNLPRADKADAMELLAMELSTGEDDEILAELDKRHEAYLKDPSTALSWEDVKAKIFAKYGF